MSAPEVALVLAKVERLRLAGVLTLDVSGHALGDHRGVLPRFVGRERLLLQRPECLGRRLPAQALARMMAMVPSAATRKTEPKMIRMTAPAPTGLSRYAVFGSAAS